MLTTNAFVLMCFVWSSSLVCFHVPFVNKHCYLWILFSLSTIVGLYFTILFRCHILILLIEVLYYYFVIYSWIIMMSSGVSGVFHECAWCHRMFKRLAGHIVQSPMCQQVYVTWLSSRRSTRWVSSNLLPRIAGSTNGPVTCNDVSLPSGDASAASEGTFCLGSHTLFRHLPSLLDAFLFWLQHNLFRLHMI